MPSTKRKQQQDISNCIASNKQPRRGQADLLTPTYGPEEVVNMEDQCGLSGKVDAAGVPLSPNTGEEGISPTDFLEMAKKLVHPFDMPVRIFLSLAGTLC